MCEHAFVSYFSIVDIVHEHSQGKALRSVGAVGQEA